MDGPVPFLTPTDFDNLEAMYNDRMEKRKPVPKPNPTFAYSRGQTIADQQKYLTVQIENGFHTYPSAVIARLQFRQTRSARAFEAFAVCIIGTVAAPVVLASEASGGRPDIALRDGKRMGKAVVYFSAMASKKYIYQQPVFEKRLWMKAKPSPPPSRVEYWDADGRRLGVVLLDI